MNKSLQARLDARIEQAGILQNNADLEFYNEIRRELDRIDKLEALHTAAIKYRDEFERSHGHALRDRWGLVDALNELNKDEK